MSLFYHLVRNTYQIIKCFKTLLAVKLLYFQCVPCGLKSLNIFRKLFRQNSFVNNEVLVGDILEISLDATGDDDLTEDQEDDGMEDKEGTLGIAEGHANLEEVF